MKAATMAYQRMLAAERVNRKHVRSLRTGKALKRLPALSDDNLVAAMAAVGPIEVCRLIKEAANEQEFSESVAKKLAAAA